MRNFYGLTVLICCAIGCTNDPGALGLTESRFSSDYGVVVVDTVSVHVSTVLLDSFPTSNTGSLLLGGYEDIKLGRIEAESYVQVGIGDAWEPPVNAIFDSLVLVARFTGYFYGDTAVAQPIEVRRLTQDFKTYSLPQFWVNEGQYSGLYADNSKFNASAMPSEPAPLGSRTFLLRPHSADSLTIRLSDELGKEWLQLAKDKSPSMVEHDKFLEYFKGLSITSPPGASSTVIGISTSDLKIRLYYKAYENEALKQQYQEYPFSTTLFNYTRFSSDRSATTLKDLTISDEEVNVTSTEDISFIQSGVGLATKITFPYLSKLIGTSNVLLVNQAQLIIEPVKDSYNSTYPLPSKLTLYHTNKTNLPLGRVYANYNSTDYQEAYISFDKEFGTSSGYNFMVTQYVHSLLSNEGTSDSGLLVMPPADEINQTVNRVYVGAGTGSYRVRLKIWYTYSK